MRRAISCVYCAPKSRIRILSLWILLIGTVSSIPRTRDVVVSFPATNYTEPGSIQPVVRRLFRDRHVMHVRLADTCAGYAHELGFAAHVLDTGATDVTHRGTQTAAELMQDRTQWSAI